MAVVVLIEDDPTLLNLTTLQLKRCGYTLFPAATVSEAKRILQDVRADVVITDQSFAEATTAEIVATVRKNRPDLPVIVYSGSEPRGISLNDRTRYVPKGMLPDLLIKTVGEVLGK